MPDELIQLLRFGGGGSHPEIDSIEISSDYFVSVDKFLLPTEDPGKGMIWYYEMLARNFNISRDIVPIAKDGGNNLFCLNFATKPPTVVMVFHENPQDQPLEVASSFGGFIDALRENPDFI